MAFAMTGRTSAVHLWAIASRFAFPGLRRYRSALPVEFVAAKLSHIFFMHSSS
jgi:hypothetical protein